MMALQIYAVGVSLIAAIALVGWWDCTTQYHRMSDFYSRLLIKRWGSDEDIERLGQE